MLNLKIKLNGRFWFSINIEDRRNNIKSIVSKNIVRVRRIIHNLFIKIIGQV